MLNRLRISRVLFFCIMALISQVSEAAADYWQMNMPKGVTPLSHDMYDLHILFITKPLSQWSTGCLKKTNWLQPNLFVVTSFSRLKPKCL